MTTCDRCGASYDLGAWPWCPHGTGVLAYQPDEVPGGFVVENGFHEPQTFYSKSEHRKALAARGLEIGAKPTRRESCADPYTMEQARRLVSRVASIKADPPEPDVPVQPFERVLDDMMLRVQGVE